MQATSLHTIPRFAMWVWLVLCLCAAATGQRDCAKSIDADCNGLSHAISNDYDSWSETCVCRCRDMWEPPNCATCKSVYGPMCNTCADEEAINYPQCDPCLPSACSNHAVKVKANKEKTACVCDCRNKWRGTTCNYCPEEYDEFEDCGKCASNVMDNYPECTKCSNVKHCSNHASSVRVRSTRDGCDCTCRNMWQGLTCAMCPEEFDEGMDCGNCAGGYIEYPTCKRCDITRDCGGRASSVTSDKTRTKCHCNCFPEYEGDSCSVCAKGYIGSFPTCIECTRAAHCSGHADSVTSENGKCKCFCSEGYEGEDCSACKAGYVAVGDSCRRCTIGGDCNGHAQSVTDDGTRTRCVCTCADKWEGDSCDVCPSRPTCPDCSKFEVGKDGRCNRCAKGAVKYPECKSCTVAGSCNGRATSVDSNEERTVCLCKCMEQYEGEETGCDRCADGYAGFPECKKCLMGSCGAADRATGVRSDRKRDVCVCACKAIYEGDQCDECSEEHINFPTCTKCTTASHCSNHAVSVTDEGRKKCRCTCRNKWEGDTCQTCPLNYDEQEDCAKCSEGHILFPTCRKCSVKDHCYDRATSTTSDSTRRKCLCICKPQYEGETTGCNSCSAGRAGFPKCDECTIGMCGGVSQASGVKVDKKKDKCVCVCNTGYEGDLCDSCAEGYVEYPNCRKCDVVSDCSDHATSVEDEGRQVCRCTCRNGWEGDSCNVCPSKYGGPDCNECTSPTGVFPSCKECNSHDHCNGRASQVEIMANRSGCVCTCRNKWEGPTCGKCPAEYDPSQDCGNCADGWVGYPSCRKCTVDHDCTGHAHTVHSDPSRTKCVCRGTPARWCLNPPCHCTKPPCVCGPTNCTWWGTCNNMWGGTNCSYCAPQYAGSDCNACATGYIKYPYCLPCSVSTHCAPVRSAGVTSDPSNQYCMCTCRAQYEGPPQCDRCAAGYYDYPRCYECTNEGHCNGHASYVTSDSNRTSCVCSCHENFENGPYGEQCDQCSPSCVNYPYCSRCTNAKDCNGRAVNVTDDGTREKCKCQCGGQYTGDKCETCPSQYGGPNCDECAEGRIGYPLCIKCDADIHCNGHAVSVTDDGMRKGCVCTCRNQWGGSRGRCLTCDDKLYDVAQDCGACVAGKSNYPMCGESCTVGTNCSNHATSVKFVASSNSCKCECRHGWSGPQCSSCPEQYGGQDCDECASGYAGTVGTGCIACNASVHCSDHACDAPHCVTSEDKGCKCVCRNQWQGADCSVCPPTFGGYDCDQCASGYHDYPACQPCDVGQCMDRAQVMVSDPLRGCVCQCDYPYTGPFCDDCLGNWQGFDCSECPPRFAGPRCDECAAGYVRYPECIKCSVDEHCFGLADSVIANGETCECWCTSSWCGGYGRCHATAPRDHIQSITLPATITPTATATSSRTPTPTATLTLPVLCNWTHIRTLLIIGWDTPTPTLTLTLEGERRSAAAEDESGSSMLWILFVVLGLCCCCFAALFLIYRRRNADGSAPNKSIQDMLMPKSGLKDLSGEEMGPYYSADDDLADAPPAALDAEEPEVEVERNQAMALDDDDAEGGDDEVRMLDEDSDEDRRDV